jgi:hypothetical protein
MRRTAVAPWVALLAFMALGACDDGDGFVDPPPPETVPDNLSAPAPPVSVINASMDIALGPLVQLVEDAIPRRFGNLDEFRESPDSGRARIAFELERAPFQAVFLDDVARLSAIILYRVRVQYDLPALPDVETSCGMGDDSRSALSVAIESPLSLGPDWSLRSRARVAELAPASTEDADRCTVTALGIDITDQLVERARTFLEGSLPKIDSLVAQVDTRSQFTEWWETLREPIELDDSLWLTFGPETIQRGPILGSGDTVSVDLGLRSRPTIVLGPRPVTNPTALPPLDSGAVVPRLDLLVDARAQYAAASGFLANELAGRTIDMDGRSVTVDSIQVYGIGAGRLAMRVRISGDLSGRLYLTGRPDIDLVTGQVSVPDLELDVATRDLVLAAASWFAARGLRDHLRERATWPTDPAVGWLTMWLERGLNRNLSDDLRVTGTVDSISIVGATALQDALWIRVAARGSARLFVQN